ncbi:MAG TPA: O-methyltransferase [Bdellovibrionales bacterium]|nr:O-methyltransferase [Bdellovibrionales bacterium]
MEKSFGNNDLAITRYAIETFRPLDSKLNAILENSSKAGLPAIQVGPMDGLHLEVLTRAFGARSAVEIGTLGGFSGACIARGLKAGGKLYTFDVNEKNALVAQKAFETAGLSDRVEILVGPALENLPKIERHGPFDLVFIDADKQNYTNYFRWAAKHLRIGGAVLADNTFAFGFIADDTKAGDEKPSVQALREFNKTVATDKRFRATILPTGEGLTLAVKISD